MNQHLGPPRQQPASSELATALGACRRAFFAIALFSGMSNILMLAGALFMLEVYDRVLPSRSVPTLVALLLLVAGLYGAQGLIDMIRSRILVRIGHSLDEAMSLRVYEAIVRLPLKIGNKGDGSQPIRDLDAVRAFLSGSGPVAFFDLPWMPVYLAICFLFHYLIGLTALAGAIILVTLTVVTEIKTRHPTRSAAQFAVARNSLLEASRRNAEVITAMGMAGRISKHWRDLNHNFVAASGRASDVGGGLGAFSRVLRMLLQSAILAVGAWLVINQESTPGIIIAGSILGGRALAPVDLAIANWRGFVGARQSWQRLSRLLGHLPPTTDPMPFGLGTFAGGAERNCGPARPTKGCLPGGQLHTGGRQGYGRDRPHRIRQIFARTHAGRGLDAGPRHRPARRRHARSMVAGGARPACRLRAAGRRIVQRHGGARHCRFEDLLDADAATAAAHAAGVHDRTIGLLDGHAMGVGEQGKRAVLLPRRSAFALGVVLDRDPFLLRAQRPEIHLDAEADAGADLGHPRSSRARRHNTRCC